MSQIMVSAVLVPSGGSERTTPMAYCGSAVLAVLGHGCPLPALVLTRRSQLPSLLSPTGTEPMAS